MKSPHRGQDGFTESEQPLNEDIKPKIAVITGPTATGKTELGVQVALELNGEVVSADSMQIYRGMDIGTAKASPQETRGVPHHMLDVADPKESWSVARYAQEADAVIKDILRRGKLPIIVGGTGLYIDAVVKGLDFAGGGQAPALREELNKKYDLVGGEALLTELAAADPQRAKKLHPSDKKRIVRALEVFISTGRTISEHDEETKKRPARYEAVKLALSFRDRDELYRRIDLRVDNMLARGLFQEVEALLASGVPENATSMQAIGYKEAARALSGEITKNEAAELIKRESRRYAKRQLTWLRRESELFWLLWESAPDFAWARRCSTDYFASRGLK